MENINQYNKVFVEVFETEESSLGEDFTVDNVDNWDSITQLSLVSDMEDAFDIMLDSDDILNFRSYEGGKEILKKYDITL